MRKNFPGRKARRRYVAGAINETEYQAALSALRVTKSGTALHRDPKLVDLPRRLLRKVA